MRCWVLGAHLLAVAGATLVAGCRRTEPASAAGRGAVAAEGVRPNIVLVTLCTFRYAHMGAAGYERDTTPFLDSLAASGVLFENAVSASSWTKPAVASILTGLTPNVHTLTDIYRAQDIIGRRITPRRVLADGVVTLAECLREAGYATAARINNIHAGDFFSMTQGFDDAVTSHTMDTSGMVDDLEAWLRGLDKDTPFFAFLLTRDPHIPYDPKYEYFVRFDRSPRPVSRAAYSRYLRKMRSRVEGLVDNKLMVPPELQQRWIDLYDAELAQLDDALKRIPAVLDELGHAANTVIVVTADHGERFFEHGKIGHSNVPDEAVVHVPLMFSGPGLPGGRRIGAVVRSIDLYPTLAALAGAEPPDVLQGTNLLPLIDGDPAGTPKLTAFSSYKNVHHTLRAGQFKLHLWPDGRRELYNLDNDPGELRNLIHATPDVAERLEDELLRWLDQEEALRQRVAHGDTRELTPEVIEQLRALGYVR